MLYNAVKNISFTEVFFHLIFWLFAIQFIFDLSGLYHSVEHLVFTKDSRFDEALLFLPLCIIIFYCNLLYLIPKFLYKGQWITYSIALIVSIIVFIYFAVFLHDFIVSLDYKFPIDRKEYLDYFIQFGLMTIIVSGTVGIAKLAFRNASSKQKAMEKQKEAEMKYLKNQFSPHFLYNTLNSLYSKAIEENAQETAEAMVTLSEIMRYPINQDSTQAATIAEEVKFINNYISIQKIRLGKDYPIIFNCDTTDGANKVLPLSLIVLVENAFKYGVSQKNKTPIIFELSRNGETIIFKTSNTISTNQDINSNNIGLKNLRLRLNLFYGNNYNLIISENENEFETILELNKKPVDNTR